MNILVSANNPGGANAILPIVQKLIRHNQKLTIILEGAARDIFNNANFNYINADKLTNIQIKKIFKTKFDLFLAGTSAGITIDKKLLSICQKKKIKSVYILDFWGNYWQRFSSHRKDFKYLPDYICVMDNLARKAMIKEGFKAKQIIVTGNPYFDNFIQGINKREEKKNRILFVSQPLSENRNYSYNEFIVLEDILKALATIKNNFNFVIRLHPRDKQNKYNKILAQNNNINIKFDKLKDIKKSISKSGLIIGMNSIVLLQAALAGKQTVSYQPNLKNKDILPSNKMGISKLVTNKNNLKKILAQYFIGNIKIKSINKSEPQSKATKNVSNFIYELIKK